jgi:hypothetical protein
MFKISCFQHVSNIKILRYFTFLFFFGILHGPYIDSTCQFRLATYLLFVPSGYHNGWLSSGGITRKLHSLWLQPFWRFPLWVYEQVMIKAIWENQKHKHGTASKGASDKRNTLSSCTEALMLSKGQSHLKGSYVPWNLIPTTNTWLGLITK